MLNVSSQTQAGFAAMIASLQHINAEVISLKEHLRRPTLKKKKGMSTHTGSVQISLGQVLICITIADTV